MIFALLTLSFFLIALSALLLSNHERPERVTTKGGNGESHRQHTYGE